MTEKIFHTKLGDIHYRIGKSSGDRLWLAFLPGLTADFHLFDKQIEYFEGRYNCFVWDAPAHGSSRPFKLEFYMDELTVYLYDIFQREGIDRPFLVGQSMGGYIAQAYIKRFPGTVQGFVSIDSAPLSRSYFFRLGAGALKARLLDVLLHSLGAAGEAGQHRHGPVRVWARADGAHYEGIYAQRILQACRPWIQAA